MGSFTWFCRWRGVGALLGMLSGTLGCSGVQTGDSGDRPCNFTTVRWPDIDAAPPTFSRAPRSLLAPLAEPVVGELLRSDGATVGLELRVTLDEGSALATYSETSESQQVACAGSVEVAGTVEAVGGDVLSGTGPVRAVASEGNLALHLDSQDFETVLHPAGDPCATAGLQLTLRLDESCSWGGDWSTAPPRANPPGVDCSAAPAPLGTFTASGRCAP